MDFLLFYIVLKMNIKYIKYIIFYLVSSTEQENKSEITKYKSRKFDNGYLNYVRKINNNNKENVIILKENNLCYIKSKTNNKENKNIILKGSNESPKKVENQIRMKNILAGK